MQIEVAVEVAREADERAAVVIPIAIERAVEHILHGVSSPAAQAAAPTSVARKR